jgi:hypothetical protein
MKRLLKMFVWGLAVAAGHLALTVIAIGKALPPNSDQSARQWQFAFDVLSFPLVYLDRLNYLGRVPSFLNFDWLPVLVVLNSLACGFVVALCAAWLVSPRHGVKA